MEYFYKKCEKCNNNYSGNNISIICYNCFKNEHKYTCLSCRYGTDSSKEMNDHYNTIEHKKFRESIRESIEYW